MNFAYALSLACGLVAFACAEEKDLRPESPLIKGYIDRDFYASLEAAIADGHREIRLKSPGGDEQVALDANVLIAENSIKIDVVGVSHHPVRNTYCHLLNR